MNINGVDRETRAILRVAMDAGWTVERTKSQHMKVTSPRGVVIITAGTASDRRACKNFRARLRRAGLRI